MEFTTRLHGRSNVDKHVQGRLTATTPWGVHKLETTSCPSWPSDDMKDGLTGKTQVKLYSTNLFLQAPSRLSGNRLECPPIFKEGDKQDTSNYRPISVLPLCMKVFERLVHNPFHTHITTNHLLNPNQSGFRPKHSTTTALIDMTVHLYNQSQNGLITGAIFRYLKGHCIELKYYADGIHSGLTPPG